MGETASQWFSAFLEMPVTLVEYAPEMEQVANADWAGRQVSIGLAAGDPIQLVSWRPIRASGHMGDARCGRRRTVWDC